MKLKELRKRKGLTQCALAEKMGVAQSTVAQWESGDRRPNIMLAPKLCKVIDCTLDELFGENVS